MLNRRGFIRIAVGASAMLSGCAPDGMPGVGARRPNIVLIMADDLGYNHLGCYGQEHIRTPHLDRLAEQGMRFTSAYSGCTVCAPARSVLMTGLHSGHTSVRGNSGGLPLADGDVTIAEVLKQGGYATGIFGKWGLGGAGTSGVPTRQGFDEFLGPLHQIHAQYYYPAYLHENDGIRRLEENSYGDSGQYAPDVMLEQALDFIRRRREEPFFLYFPSLVPHHEYQVPAESMEEYRGKFGEAPFIREDRGFVVQHEPAAAFAGMVTRLDEHVGRLLEELDAHGLAQDTLVIFTSDNGAAGSFQPLVDAFHGSGSLRGFKGDLYEGGVRVPFLARWPGKIQEGSSTAQPIAFWDLLPTFAEIGGVEAPSGIDGVSITPTLLGPAAVGREQQQHEFFYWETRGGLEQAARMGGWKAVRHDPDEPLELYDLSADRSERRDLAAVNPDVVRKMEAYLETARTEPEKRPEPGWSKEAPLSADPG